MNIPPDALASAIATSRAPVVLDVRSRVEYTRGHVPGAIHVPFWLVPWRLARIPAAPPDPLVVYCGHGPRAWFAGAMLRRHGFTHVRYLAGHMARWIRQGWPRE
jgi:rhodanese-related sulfurtransferase